MKFLLSHLSPPHPLFPFQPYRWRNHSSYSLSPHGIRVLRFPLYAPRCVAAPSPADSATFNGWDDLRIRVGPGHSTDSNLVRSYLTSLGFDDNNYVFVYILGFVCALAISRVRVSSIVVVPAAAIVFAIGFSFGFVNGGPRGGAALNLNGGKRTSKGEDLRVHGGKLRNLMKLFDDFDGRLGKLKDNIIKGVQNRRVGVDDLESYVDALELMGLCVKNARNVVQECIGCDSVDDYEVERNLNKKLNRKKKESGDNVSNWFQLVSRFFKHNEAGAKSSKKKDSVKNESKHTSNLPQDDLLASPDEERVINSKYANDAGRPNRRNLDNAYSYQSFDFNRKGRLDYEGKKISGISQNGNFTFMEVDKSRELLQSRINESFNDGSGRELNIQSDRVRFIDDQQVTLRMSEYDETAQWISHDGLDDNIDFQRRRISSRHEKLHRNFNGAFESSRYRQKGEYENNSKPYRERTDAEGNLLANDDPSRQEREFVASSSSILSDDALFDRYLTEAHSLLKEAKECLRVKDNEMRVEQMLQDSAKLLSRALSLKPMSLLAMGLLGNTYLLHGELKFRFSQELRYLLSGSDNLNFDRWNNIPVSKDELLPAKDELVTRLIDVCEECEELLVEAGRKYRMALSIDGNDVRALYNWGLALSFRAQLIADIGPEAASDADRLFLAAIDKFDAMMSRSKTYAPDALYRWGLVLQQRSRLRPSNSKDKVRLLQQAKRLYEDALEMGFDKMQAREALSSCVLELNPGR